MMTLRHFFAAIALVFVAALPASAATESVSDPLLLPDGTVVMAQRSVDAHTLFLLKRTGDVQRTEIIPTPADVRLGDPRLAYDARTSTLFLVVRLATGTDGDQVVLLTRDSEGLWAQPRLIAKAEAAYSDLKIAVSRSKPLGANQEDPAAFLIHSVWRVRTAKNGESPEYAVVAYAGSEFVAQYHADLISIAGRYDDDPTSDKSSRPLSISAADDQVDIVFSVPGSDSLSRLRFKPVIDARVISPVGRWHTRVRYRSLESNASIQALTVGNHVTLYTVDGDMFRYAINTDGVWEPIRSTRIDEEVTAQDMIRELTRTLADR